VHDIGLNGLDSS